jgi:hypothetical protein
MDNNEITITGNVAKWTLPPTQGEMLGTYTGHFEFKTYLTPTQMLEAGREYRSLLGNLPEYASEKEKNISFALVELKYRVIKAPPFWTATLQESGYAGNIPDLNIIVMVLEKAMVAESMFQEKLQKERDSLLDRTIKSAEQLAEKKNKSEE